VQGDNRNWGIVGGVFLTVPKVDLTFMRRPLWSGFGIHKLTVKGGCGSPE
jgi:hypothetical protein